ncbi:hypothetical protein [Leptospira andrefontaineae]|uniref:DUF1566 domain-containing protein n=1 Tax=Leptospira andrefontaineae TaxID=2484976 RepID=A0A4V3JFS4_9LEPT|nr:hypothetical protein [Leptospira andrefontaineae]TGK38810.1 hypothetical protein EHO65_12255 [Leptospira andrefontaineae]
MKHLSAILLFSIISILNCAGPKQDDLSGLLLLLAGGGGPGNSSHCGQTVANPVSVSFGVTNGNYVTESNLLAALGGDNCSTPSLTDNNNGTVTDSANRFIWTLCVLDDSSKAPNAFNTPNCDAFDANDGIFSQTSASTACSNLTYAGRSNWILPDAIRLHSLRIASSPYVLGAFGSANNSLGDSGTAWSSTVINGTIETLGITPLYETVNVFRAFTPSTDDQTTVVCVAEY